MQEFTQNYIDFFYVILIITANFQLSNQGADTLRAWLSQEKNSTW